MIASKIKFLFFVNSLKRIEDNLAINSQVKKTAVISSAVNIISSNKIPCKAKSEKLINIMMSKNN